MDQINNRSCFCCIFLYNSDSYNTLLLFGIPTNPTKPTNSALFPSNSALFPSNSASFPSNSALFPSNSVLSPSSGGSQQTINKPNLSTTYLPTKDTLQPTYPPYTPYNLHTDQRYHTTYIPTLHILQPTYLPYTPYTPYNLHTYLTYPTTILLCGVVAFCHR